MSKTNKPQAPAQPRASVEKSGPDKGVDICPVGSVFNCTTEGLATTGDGRARMYSALHGIETLAALLFQRELDKDCGCGIEISQNVTLGLLSALGSCTEFAQNMLDGSGGRSRIIDTKGADYPALERLVSGGPA